MPASLEQPRRRYSGIHKDLILMTAVTVIACLLVSLMGLCLLLNVFSAEAIAVFGEVKEASSRIVFTLVGALFVGIGSLGAGWTPYRAWQQSAIVAQGQTQAVEVKFIKDEWSDSSSYYLEIEAGPLAGSYAIYSPPKSLKLEADGQMYSGLAYTYQTEIGAVEIAGHLIWCH